MRFAAWLNQVGHTEWEALAFDAFTHSCNNPHSFKAGIEWELLSALLWRPKVPTRCEVHIAGIHSCICSSHQHLPPLRQRQRFFHNSGSCSEVTGEPETLQ